MQSLKPVDTSKGIYYQVIRSHALFIPMEFSIKLQIVHCTLYIESSQLFPKYIVFLSLKIEFVLATSADADEMQRYAAFHLGIHCLPTYPP